MAAANFAAAEKVSAPVMVRSRPGPWTAALLLGLGLVLNTLAAESAHPLLNPTNCLLHPSLEISLFASEPDVVDPVALTFDAAGRMYVVEMRDYPYGFGSERKPGGTVRLLEDTNHDGRADRSTVFAEDLSFPTSICAWNGGVLVTAPPEIIFLKDTDGDGRADVREVMFRGFTLGVTDSNVNGLRWGLDNRVHGLNGGNGGRISSLRKPGPASVLDDLDFSFNPGTGDFATTFHSSRGFGLVFDEWGRSFVTYNINHIQHRFLPQRYLRRFPGFAPLRATSSISDHGDLARIFRISTAETRPNHPEQAGHFSAAGGMGYVGWKGFGPELYGSVLVCDVVGNLVHRDLIQADGPVFRAVRAPTEQASEFFASRDNACRPVGMESGPDGALYLIDMQRDVIEHPDYIPENVRAKLNLRAGEDRGRIYRITPKNVPVIPWRNLEKASTDDLIEYLSHPNQWQRMTAQRLLVESQQKEAVSGLKQLAKSGKEPLGRLHALWTLNGLNALGENEIRHGLSDTHPGVRENALVLAEGFLPESKAISERVIGLANDPSERVRFQAALTLGQVEQLPIERERALKSLLLRDYEQRWTRVAVLSSMRKGVADVLADIVGAEVTRLKRSDSKSLVTSAPTIELIAEVAELAVVRDGASGLSAVFHCLSQEGWNEAEQLAALKGLNTGLARSGTAPPKATPEVASALRRLMTETSNAGHQSSTHQSASLGAAAWRVARALGLSEAEGQRQLLAAALLRAKDTSLAPAEREPNIALLALGSYPAVKDTLFGLLSGNEPASIQQAGLFSLKEFNDPDVAQNLVSRWRMLAPSARPSALSLLLQRQSYHAALIQALESGSITVGELNLDLEQRRRLLWRSTQEIQARAAKLLGDGEYANRKSVVEQWLGRLPASGDAQRGKTVFEQRCAQCHLVNGLGHRVGPELTGMSHRSVEDLLSNILDPNMAINPAYVTYTCETSSGEVESGLLHAESGDAITLLQAGEKQVSIPRSKIIRLQSSGLSLMPERLEEGLTPVDLRDLIAFLQQSP